MLKDPTPNIKFNLQSDFNRSLKGDSLSFDSGFLPGGGGHCVSSRYSARGDENRALTGTKLIEASKALG